MKFLGYQVLVIGVIWLGMAMFYKDMTDASRLIFYIVTSWLLFLIVLLVKEFIRSRKTKE